MITQHICFVWEGHMLKDSKFKVGANKLWLIKEE